MTSFPVGAKDRETCGSPRLRPECANLPSMLGGQPRHDP